MQIWQEVHVLFWVDPKAQSDINNHQRLKYSLVKFMSFG
jgi:hypothetical protein